MRLQPFRVSAGFLLCSCRSLRSCMACRIAILPVQVIEKLYRLKWGSLDGLGALVILPTRELALQVFNELRKVGKHHDFSAGLLVGGRNVKEEQQLVGGERALKAGRPRRLVSPQLLKQSFR